MRFALNNRFFDAIAKVCKYRNFDVYDCVDDLLANFALHSSSSMAYDANPFEFIAIAIVNP